VSLESDEDLLVMALGGTTAGGYSFFFSTFFGSSFLVSFFTLSADFDLPFLSCFSTAFTGSSFFSGVLDLLFLSFFFSYGGSYFFGLSSFLPSFLSLDGFI
jgi:hypothetical protein